MPKYVSSSQEGPFLQCEIVSGLVQVRLDLGTLGSTEQVFVQVVHPYAIILSQDCDLEQEDRRMKDEPAAERRLPNILFCEATSAEGLRPSINGKDIWKRIYQNNDERYQFIEEVPSDQDASGTGLEALVIDFKRYFTLPTEEVYARRKARDFKRRCQLKHPYSAQVLVRFFSFQNRIALPEEHSIKPSPPPS